MSNWGFRLPLESINWLRESLSRCPAMPAPTVFVSYSHKDESWKNKLLPQLHALERAGIDMRVWHDRKIDGGDQWYPEIQEAMANAAVGVLLISPDFLASGFINKEEVPYL